MSLDNDIRGWILTCASGIACVAGASIICIDLLIQRLPGKKDFRIQDSNGFLACSLSLSFGVMAFSSLYSMLPSAQRYLHQGGLTKSRAAYITIGGFLIGAVGIQIISRILHLFIPSHVVDCHHEENESGKDKGEHVDVGNDHEHQLQEDSSRDQTCFNEDLVNCASESTPLLREGLSAPERGLNRSNSVHECNAHDIERQEVDVAQLRSGLAQRPRLAARLSSLVLGPSAICQANGICYGYGDPCSQQCVQSGHGRGDAARIFGRFAPPLDQSRSLVSTSSTDQSLHDSRKQNPTNASGSAHKANSTRALNASMSKPQSCIGKSPGVPQRHHSSSALRQASHNSPSTDRGAADNVKPSTPHHHHVPSNAFLAIGLQTSIAIALHKIPEGFITYATNHASPTLGFSVFMALFIHNITEGFAMALPLYMAIQSRWQAMLWSSLLGGVSQPVGAGVAALCFKVAGRSNFRPGNVVYGCMFAITAGIMASVALQLYSESLTLAHNRNVCILFAFLGMAILGTSYALTA